MTAKGRRKKAKVQAKKKTYEDMRITEWTNIFQKIYDKVDSGRSPIEIWVAATNHFSDIGEAIRRMNFADIMYSAAHAFCWMCSFVLACRRDKGTVFELDESFSSIVACKYPLVCGHCQEAFCHCKPKRMDEKKDKAAEYKELAQRRENISHDTFSPSRWLAIFDSIYGQHIHMLTLESIGFHFLEEGGEELGAIRGLKQLEGVVNSNIEGINEAFLVKLTTFEGVLELYDQYKDLKPEMNKKDAEAIRARLVHAKVKVFIEFGDTFSWFCSIINKVISIAKNCKEDNCRFTKQPFLQELLKEYMPDGKPCCPSCGQCPCDCVFYN